VAAKRHGHGQECHKHYGRERHQRNAKPLRSKESKVGIHFLLSIVVVSMKHRSRTLSAS
jgi:hypothetical protein